MGLHPLYHENQHTEIITICILIKFHCLRTIQVWHSLGRAFELCIFSVSSYVAIVTRSQ